MITLRKISSNEIPLFHKMQVEAFMPLLLKYKDYSKNPACETIEKLYEKYANPDSSFYFIWNNETILGGTRIHLLANNKTCRIAPIFIIPEHQDHGYAQQAIYMLEELYKPIQHWTLDTALQEIKLCYLYEKIGYTKTGETEIINELLTIIYYEKYLKFN